MKLFYLTRANLMDKVFIHDFAFHFPQKTKAIILHDLFGTTPEDTQFVSKRLSAVLSESMIVNFPVSGNQRNLLSGNPGTPAVKAEIIHKAFETVSVFISNRLISNNESEGANAAFLLDFLKKEFSTEEILFFPSNSRSAMNLSPISIGSLADREKALSVFEEEREIIELTFQLRPAKIVSPSTMNS